MPILFTIILAIIPALTLHAQDADERATYINRLSRLPVAIEMPYCDEVRHHIDRYAGMRSAIGTAIGTANFYTPIFEEALERYNLPLELKYLPLVESAYNPEAVSRAGAAGLWQFMITTAKQYGLTVNSLIDERMDPVKASDAAARYLADLYGTFNSWHLALAAYNCGPENVNKAMRRAGQDTIDYWSIASRLPAETQKYVPAFIAANYIMAYYCEHDIAPAAIDLPLPTDTVVVTRNLHFEQIADFCPITTEQLKALNPQYRRNVIPGETQPCSLRMPTEAINAFIDAGDTIYQHRADELLHRKEIENAKSKAPNKNNARGAATVKVRRGDTLGAIAKRHGTTVARLQELNGLSGTALSVGQRLKVK